MTANSVYFDSSALVKLVVKERESPNLRAWIPTGSRLVTCLLARTEVIRSVRPFGSESVTIGRALFRRLEILTLDASLLDSAGMLDPTTLRSLDAIHLASALTLRDELVAVVTYDRRMAEGAIALGLPVVSPGACPSRPTK